MLSLRVFVCVVASAAGLSLRGDAPVEVKPADFTCPLTTAHTSFVLADDEALDKAEPSTADKQKKAAFQMAQSKLMTAMDALLEVPSVDVATLENVANGKTGKDTLVVFYAPWCPHCQTFVLHDGKGNPTKAPLEEFRRDLAEADATKNVNVMRADVTKTGQKLPAAFPVQSIPSVYWVSKDGKESKYEGDPHSLVDLKKFVQGHL